MVSRSGVHSLAIIMWCLAASVATAPAASRGSELWKGLKRGPFEVGVAIRHERDPDRLFGAQNAPRPIQMLVWYPASPTEGKTPVTYENYFISAATEIVFSTTKTEYDRRHIQEVRDMVRTSGASEELFDRQIARSTWAIADAIPATGVFPLLIYAPGLSGKSFQNVVLCEFLASHGFVVAASPSVGPRSRDMPQTLDGIQAQIDDIQFVMKTMARIRYVNAGKIGLVGYSWGGMTALLASMSDGGAIRAVAALDPHLMAKNGHELARTAPGYAPEDLHIPVMLPIASAQKWKERDFSFFDELTGSEALLLEFNNFTHGDFSSTIIQFIDETRKDRKKKESDGIRLGYATLCRYLEAFFSAHLQDDAEARAFLAGSPSENGVPAGVLTIKRSSPQVTTAPRGNMR
jgi:dienelactone hydrolase